MVEEIVGSRENHCPAVRHQQYYHIMLYPVLKYAGIKLRILTVIATNFIGRCKFNYLMIMAMADRVKEKKISNQ